MKTPQQIKEEVEKKDYKEVDKWIEECDVDGRMIEFEFFDSDIEDLKNCIKREKLSILTEYDKSINLEILRLLTDIERHWDKVPNQKESVIRGLKQILSKIGDVQQTSEEKQDD